MYIYYILAGCPLLLIITALVLVKVMLVVVTVENDSMSPTLIEGDRLLVLRQWPAKWLHKGQIVLIWPWLTPSSDHNAFGKGVLIPFIKRIVGLPGDELATYLSELDEFHQSRESSAYDGDGKRLWRVPPGHVFVRGDHLPGGWDSLSWGPIPVYTILGVVIMKLPKKVSSEPRRGTNAQKPSHAAPGSER